jgi:hypothetical protein
MVDAHAVRLVRIECRHRAAVMPQEVQRLRTAFEAFAPLAVENPRAAGPFRQRDEAGDATIPPWINMMRITRFRSGD